MFDRPLSARSFLAIFGMLGVVLPLLAMLAVEPIDGDLTRIGLLPEVAFGANVPQPRVERRPSSVPSLAQADLLVVGDSFSIDGVWQAMAFKDEVRFGTMHWAEGLCDDFPAALRAAHAAPRVLVLQSVERHLKDHMPANCAQSRVKWRSSSAAEPRTTTALRDRLWIFEGAFGYPYIAGSLSFLWAPKAQHRDGAYGGVDVKPVAGGCAYFSNARCEFGLFLGWDATKNAMDERMPSAVRDSLTRVTGFAPTVVLVVVPDKSSVYLGSLDAARRKDAALLKLTEGNGLVVVPLFERFHVAARKVKDFYLPNNTHLSALGYKQLAIEIGAAIAAVRPDVLRPKSPG